jgi:acetylornithine/N-succinyldiaminopimelate aminotransferase
MQPTSFDDIKSAFDAYVIGNYGRAPIAFVRGEGSYIWDSNGDRYVDLMPGWGTTLLGHCHPRVVTAIQHQASTLIHVDNSFYIPVQAELAQKISEHSFGGKVFFCNSGAEAAEAALKLARIHTEQSGRYKIISMLDSFHGRTMAAIRATGQPKYHRGVPHVEGFSYVPLNDMAAVEAAADDETCAVMLEPLQGEGGINVPDEEFIADLRAFCDANGILLVFDEVQTGIGRTGKWFGYQHYGVEPDIMTLAKALGSGVAIGAMVAGPEIAADLVPGTHASTFGGNPLACAAALATIKVIEDEGLLAVCAETSAYIVERLNAMAEDYAIIEETRGRGVMLGIQLNRPGTPVFEYCLANKVRLNCTHETVVRLLPAMNIPRDVLDEGLAVLDEALAKAEAGEI